MVTVAVDAMGGDRAPGEVVAGAVEVAATTSVRVLLTGPADVLAAELQGHGRQNGIEVVAAPDVIDASDEPAAAVRAKPDSSMARACRLVRDGAAGAVVSAGPTGAMLAASLLHIGRLRGILRPGIAAVLPAQGGPCLLIDAGANADARPEHLVQFAANCEGRDVLTGAFQVVVADGFTGNVLLKGLEGAAVSILGQVRSAAASSLRAKVGGLLLRPALVAVRERTDPEAYGGAYLLGLRGLAVIAHGNVARPGVANAIRYAARGLDADVVGRLERRVSAAAPGTDLQAEAAANTVSRVAFPENG